jgi:hypothetical protein
MVGRYNALIFARLRSVYAPICTFPNRAPARNLRRQPRPAMPRGSSTLKIAVDVVRASASLSQAHECHSLRFPASTSPLGTFKIFQSITEREETSIQSSFPSALFPLRHWQANHSWQSLAHDLHPGQAPLACSSDVSGEALDLSFLWGNIPSLFYNSMFTIRTYIPYE